MDGAICLVDWPDFARVAEALGGTACTIENAAGLAGLGSAIAKRDRPMLIDLRIDPFRKTTY